MQLEKQGLILKSIPCGTVIAFRSSLRLLENAYEVHLTFTGRITAKTDVENFTFFTQVPLSNFKSHVDGCPQTSKAKSRSSQQYCRLML
jgi:hypothetical protein